MSNPQNGDCVFCRRASKEPWDKKLAETLDYVILPTKGALIPGWLLVVSKNHRICSGALDSQERTTLVDATDVARGLVEGSFGAATLFEHGPSVPGTPVGCGIDHLHIHVAPLGFSLAKTCTQMFGSEWCELNHPDALQRVHKQGTAYIAVKEPGEPWLWCAPPAGVRQPFRRAIAFMLGMPERFDYRTDSFLPNVVETVQQISVER
jgi:hypothetical protein